MITLDSCSEDCLPFGISTSLRKRSVRSFFYFLRSCLLVYRCVDPGDEALIHFGFSNED